MQKTIYLCDTCSVMIGEKKHISMRFDQFTGIAMPPDKKANVWHVLTPKNTNKNFAHFCTGACAGKFFTKALINSKII